jgi:predicted transposase/invertase (TIGR01784 family)
LEHSEAAVRLFADYNARLEFVQDLTMLDDRFFSITMQHRDSCQEVLRVLTGKEDLIVEEVTPQRALRGASSHSVTLDVLASDSSGKVYDIEVQTTKESGYIRRMRYYAAMIDSSYLDPGEKYEKLPELYLITLTPTDFLQGKKVRYEVQRAVPGLDCDVDNGIHEVYINAAVKDGSDLSELMQFLASIELGHAKFPALSKRIQQYKTEEKGVTEVSAAFEILTAELMQKSRAEGREEGRAEGFEKGEERAKEVMVRNAVKMGLSIDAIVQLTGLSEKEIREVEANAQEK